MPRNKSFIDLIWPVAGLDRSLPFQRQPPYTTPDAQNVRPDGSISLRERGGSRPGLRKAFRTPLGGPIRMLTKLAVLDQDQSSGYSFLNILDLPSQSGIYSGLKGMSGGRAIVTLPSGLDPNGIYEVEVVIAPADGATALNGSVSVHLDLPTETSDPLVDSITVRITFSGSSYQIDMLVYESSVLTATHTTGSQAMDPLSSGILSCEVNPGTNEIIVRWRHATELTQTIASLDDRDFSVSVDSSDGSVVATDITHAWVRDPSLAVLAQNPRRDLVVAVAGGTLFYESFPSYMTPLVTSTTLRNDVELQAVDREQKLYIADYGIAGKGEGASIAASSYDTLTTGTLDAGISTDHLLQILDSDYSQNTFQDVYVDGADGGTFRLIFKGSPTADIAWDANAAAVQSALAALNELESGDIAVTGDGTIGTPWRIEFQGQLEGKEAAELDYLASGLTDSTTTATIVVNVTTVQIGNGGTFIAGTYNITGVGSGIQFSPSIPVGIGFTGNITGVKYEIAIPPKVFDPKEGTLTVHAASKGVTPAGARLVTLYRDRIVYAGSDNFPHLWWMSRQGDPDDWDFSQEDSGAAVFAQASVGGQLADPVTAMIPHSDECLIIGSYNSLWILRGDPGYGGSVDQLSRKIGIVGQNAWCRTPDDMVVFLSHDGVYVIPAGCSGFPSSISRERLPDELICKSTNTDAISLEYDSIFRGVHISLTRRDGGTGNHWWFDWESKSFWRVSLHEDHEPFSSHERVLWGGCPSSLMGCRDGYIREFDRDTHTDDGEHEIESYIDFGPFMLDRGGFNEGILAELRATLGHSSGAVDWEVRAGDGGETAFLAAVRESGTWGRHGLNYNSLPRVRGVAAIVRVKNSEKVRWVLERVTGIIQGVGKRRVR